MATIKTDLICNLNQPVNVTYLHGNLFSQDNAGNTINVFVMDNGEPATIGGTVSANVIRSDGQTVAVSGAIEGNKAYVILPQACYAVPGVVHIIIKLTQNTTITTIAAIVANVYMSTTDAVIDPGTVIPSIQALIALIEEAVDSIPTDYTGLLHTIAADYSSSKTYKVGDYAWESGVLKRCIVPITAAETYTAAHWTNAVIGDDLTNLKSALVDQRQTYNLMPQSYYSFVNRGNPTTINGITYDVKGNGEILVSGTASANSTYRIAYSDMLLTLPAGTYRFLRADSAATQYGDLIRVGVQYVGSSSYDFYFTADGTVVTLESETQLIISIVVSKNGVIPTGGLLVMPMIANANADYGYIAPWASLANYVPNAINYTKNSDEEIQERIKRDSFMTPYGIEPFQMSLFKHSENLFSDFCYHITEAYYRFRISTTPEMQPRITTAVNWQGWLIHVKPNTVYTLGELDFKLELLDKDFNSDITIDNMSDTDPNTITTGSNSYWLCLTQRVNKDMSQWMMVEGDTYPSEYISGYPQWVALPTNPDETNIKTVAFMGDSITAGVATHKCYHQYIHDVFGYTCLNYGYGGAGWSWVYTGTSSGKIGQGVPGIGVNTTAETAFTPNNVVARLSELDPDVVDCIVIFAGTNDWGHSVSISDLTTAIDSAFEYCKTNLTEIPVLVMTPIHRRYDTTPNSQGKTLREYADVIIEECKKYSIAYIDTMTVSGLYPDNQANREYYFDQNQESGLHPSSTGHKLIAVGVGEMIKELMLYSDLATP